LTVLAAAAAARSILASQRSASKAPRHAINPHNCHQPMARGSAQSGFYEVADRNCRTVIVLRPHRNLQIPKAFTK
jgi:hypothetical protein